MANPLYKQGDILSYLEDSTERVEVLSIQQRPFGESVYVVKCLWNGSHFTYGDIIKLPYKAVDERFRLVNQKKNLITKTRRVTRR